MSAGREGLKDDITIVPVGGLDKVSTFISLLRSNSLNIVCLLDTFKDTKGKAKIEDLIQQKIITDKKIKFFHDYLTGYTTADIEDIFAKEDYLKLYNEAFPSKKIELKDLNSSIKPIVIQITDYLKSEFNHYRPANVFARKILNLTDLGKVSVDNFEKIFKDINRLF